MRVTPLTLRLDHRNAMKVTRPTAFRGNLSANVLVMFT